MSVEVLANASNVFSIEKTSLLQEVDLSDYFPS